MGENGECRRLNRFLERWGDTYPIFVVDNGSVLNDQEFPPGVEVLKCYPHYGRGQLHDYPAIWRIYWELKNLFQEYDRIFFFSTDSAICSQRMMDYLESLTSGWTAFWCHRHPEDQIQVITPCREFMKFFYGPSNPFKYNGAMAETLYPFTHVERGFVGDRYGELGSPPYIPGTADYYTQVPDDPAWPDFLPIIRRVDGVPTVLETAEVELTA